MNRGLKGYTGLLETKLESASGYINLNYNDANLIFVVPLYNLKMPKELDLSLIYNYQNRTETGLFGKGFKLNLYANISQSGNNYIVTNSDGSSDEYVYQTTNTYKNTETQNTLTITSEGGTTYYNITTKNGYIYKYNLSVSANYPVSIGIGSSERTTVNLYGSTKKIETTVSNASNYTITFEVDTTFIAYTRINKIICSGLPVSTEYVIEYTNEYISSITYKLNNTVSRELIFSFNAGAIYFIDATEKHNFSYNIDTNTHLITFFCESFSLPENPKTLTTLINYFSHDTKVTDFYNNVSYYLFEDDENYATGRLMYIINENEYVQNGITKQAFSLNNFEYDSNGLLKHQSSIIKYNPDNTNLLSSKRVNIFTNNQLSLTNYDVITNSPFYRPALGDIADYVSGTGTLTKTVYLTGNTGDNFLISMLVKLTSNYNANCFYLELLYGGINKRTYLRKKNNNSEYELVTMGIHLESTITNIKITIGLSNSSMVIGGVMLMRKDFGVNYTYDSSNNLVSAETSNGTTNYTYNSNNLVSNILYPDNTSEAYTYSFINNEYKIASVVDENGVKEEYTYEHNGNIEFYNLKRNNYGQYISIHNVYNSNGTLSQERDELDNTTSYNYYNSGLLYRVHSPLETSLDTVYIEYYYDSSDNAKIDRIKLYSNACTRNTYYTYTSCGKLDTVDNSNGSLFSYDYNGYLDYIGLSLNNSKISEIDYTSDKYLPETIKYGTNSDGYRFIYDGNNNYSLTNIKYVTYLGILKNRFDYEYDYHGMLKQIYFYPYNNSSQVLLKEYTYDNDDRVSSISSAYLNYTFDYTYDNNGIVKIVKHNINGNKKYMTYDSDKNHSSTTLNTIDQNLLNLYDIVTLNDNVVSIKGVKPYIFNKFSGNPFVYDESVGRMVFYPTYGNLAYNFGFNESGSVIARLKPTDVSSKQMIYSLYDGSNYVDLFVQSGHLYLSVFGANYNTNLIISSSVWSRVGISYTKRIVGTSNFQTYLDVRVYCNGNTYENSFLMNNSFYAEYVHIGKRHNNSYRFSGYFSNIAFRSAYSELSTLSYLSTELIDYVITYKTDFVYRVSEKQILSNNNIIKNSYFYKNMVGSYIYTSHIVSSELISSPWFTANRTYTYDKLNRVTAISDSTFGSHTYTYDECGMLASETFGSITISYEYDFNGNIKKVTRSDYQNNPLIFTYDNTIKDRLTYCGNNQVYYSNSSPGNIAGFGNQEYLYEGKRLIEINSSSGNQHTQIKYTYDDEGLLVKKSKSVWYDDDTEGYDEDTLYFYENGNLVTEIKDNTRNDYLYDTNGNLYGFIVNNYDKYFYVRDILGNILGIVSSTGSLLRKYDYDAFGYIHNVTNYSSFNAYNPFVYKGYYYDEDSYMYYLKSRFYNPELRRFITPDNINYLDITNVGCVNLYAYCNNNPVMYVDYDGNLAGIGLAITLISLFIAATIASAGLVEYENQTHSLENLLNELFNSINNVYNDFTNYVQQAKNKPYERKKAAPRIKKKTRKEAEQAAFLKGGKTKPIFHNGKHGKHFHPNNPKFKHWHYYFSIITILSLFDDEYDEDNFYELF